MFRLKRIFLTVSALAFLYGCGSDKQKESTDSEDFLKAKEELKQSVKNVLYEIPPPAEVPYLIQATGVAFDPELLNHTEKSESYTNSTTKGAINLGIYAVDIAYLASFEKVQKALNYMETAVELGESIGLKGAMDMALIKKFENNLSEKDSLADIVNNVINDADDYLKDNQRNNVAALMLGGTFIEGLYITTQLIENYPDDMLEDSEKNLVLTPLIKIVLNQEKPLAELLKLLNSLEDKDDWSIALINSLEELQKNYKEIGFQDKLAQNQGALIVTDETLRLITRQVASIRTNFTY